MLQKIAWRNVWRSRGRTLTIVMAISVGVAALSLLTGFINGFIQSFVSNAIKGEYSHIQIHDPQYKADRELKYSIEASEEILAAWGEKQQVEAMSARTLVNGMISSTKSANGVLIYGIDPEMEDETTGLASAVKEGDYFESISRNPILVSKKTADKLQLKLRSKIVLTFQNTAGDITAGSFRVAGIFETTSKRRNNGTVFVRQNDLQRLIGENSIQEIAILLSTFEQVEEVKRELKSDHPKLQVESWDQLAPEVALMQDQVWTNMIFLLVIIMGALCFGIVNTMLMAVLERTRELGMLMAVGMKKTRVFWMIVRETLLMSAIGAPIGLAIGLGVNQYFLHNGLNLTNFSEGLKEFGYDPILYPEVLFSDYVIIVIAVVVTTLLAAIYPARKATKLKPAQALHTI